MSIKQMLERIEEECDNKDYELLMAEKRIAELERELADAQGYAAELETQLAGLEAEE